MGQGKGINNLAAVINGQMERHAETTPDIDFGTVKKNGCLVPDSFPATIDRGDYSVLERFRHNGSETRVLIAWVENQAVIIDRLAGQEDGENG
ncbi:MAG: hypothetical protein HFH69_12470 [Lachnospiraceae bacterium]|nr:hypothetical protein [Lachnospiraceae bacterium]